MNIERLTEEQQNNLRVDFADDLDTIEIICDFTDQEFADASRLEVNEVKAIKSGSKIPDKAVANTIYNYAYKKNIMINDILWQEYKEEYSEPGYMVLSHGSRSGIKGAIRLDMNGDSNDFANGFYCGQSFQQAGMFVSDSEDASLYIVRFNAGSGLKPARFFTSNEWMLAVAWYRDRIPQYEDNPIIQSIIDKVESADYVIAPIADNQLFEIIDAFAQGSITDKQARFALAATHLGFQYVFKTSACIDKLEILRRCYLCPLEKANYIAEAEQESNTSINKAIMSKKKFEGEGLYIHELLDKAEQGLTEDYAPHNLTLEEYKQLIHERRPWYNVDKITRSDVAYRMLDRIIAEDEKKKLSGKKTYIPKELKMGKDEIADINGKPVTTDGEYFYYDGIKFESDSALEDYIKDGDL